jgi:hypothetical protein
VDTTRIKMKIGLHEFEAEGPTEIVNGQFEDFKKLIANVPASTSRQMIESRKQSVPEETTDGRGPEYYGLDLKRICKVDGRVISLTIKPKTEGFAAEMIMLGHKVYRGKDTVTASEIKDGLIQSGYKVARVDRIMQPVTDSGEIVKIGARKGTRYRFTNQGFAVVEEAVREIIDALPN